MQKLSVTTFKSRSGDNYYYLLIFVTIILAYIIPLVLQQAPSGTDVYTHMFYTKIFIDSDSLDEFYTTCLEREYLGFDYPFGMWIFGAIVAKISGINLLFLSYLLPLLLLFITVLIFYAFSGIFISSRRYRILSLVFLLAIPNFSLSILNYSTSLFTVSIVLLILYLTFSKKVGFKKFIILVIPTLFFLCSTHTGTYMFLLFLSFSYLFTESILSGKSNERIYILVASLLFLYAITLNAFPYIHPQYIDKSRLLLTIGESASSLTNLKLFEETSELFYTRIFLDKNFIDISLWIGLIYILNRLIISSRSKVIERLPKKIPRFKNPRAPVTIPLIGNVTNISHSVITTPFWVGPINSVLSIPGIFRLNHDGKILFIATVIVTVLPGSMTMGETGALREIFYLYIVIPITAALGFGWVQEKLGKYTGRKNNFFVGVIFFTILSTSLLMPIVGSVYYKPTISGSETEKSGFSWLKGVGTSDEGCTGLGYRHMINIYGEKEVPDSTTVAAGSDYKNFFNALKKIYLSEKSEKWVDEIYSSYGARYFISSPRVLRGFSATVENLTIESNKQLDKLYETKGDFSIHRYIYSSAVEYKISNLNGVNFNEEYPEILETGSDFLIETDTYKFKIGKDSPEYKYLGNEDGNFLGEGSILDYLRLTLSDRGYDGEYKNYILNELNFSVRVNGNEIIYKKNLTNQDGTKNLATLLMKYKFFKGTIKNELIISNDQSMVGNINAYFSTFGFMPFIYFQYTDWYGTKNEKRIYPSEDSVRIKDKKFKSIFLNDGIKGIYLKYEDTAPYPSNIIYSGSTIYNFSSIDLNSVEYIHPGSSLHVTRYISVGDKNTVESNSDYYSSVSIYPYPNGSIPLILTSYIENLGASSQAELENINTLYERLEEIGISEKYTEGLYLSNDLTNPGLTQKISEAKINIMGYIDFSRSYANLTKEEEIRSLLAQLVRINENATGFIPRWLTYDLGTINALNQEGALFIETNAINSPIGEFYQEGLRHPQIASYQGEKTGLVILPVSNPTSALLRGEYNVDDTINSWKSTINSAVKNDDLCIFIWRSSDIGKPEYIDDIFKVIEHANNSQMTFTTPSEIAKHYLALQNIDALVSKETDNIQINVNNRNNETVTGVTLKVILPTIDNKCTYAANNAEIVRFVMDRGQCRCYVSTDLQAHEQKTLLILPLSDRKRFVVTLQKGPVEGEIIFLVKDEDSNPVGNAEISIGKTLYETDADGYLRINLKRGIYPIKIEKPGFEKSEYDFEVKGRFYYFETLPPWVYLGIALVVIALILIDRKKKSRAANSITIEQS